MKIRFLYILPLILILMHSCVSDRDGIFVDGMDPEFTPETREFLIDTTHEVYHACFYENNDIEISINTNGFDSVKWYRKNNQGNFYFISENDEVKTANTGVLRTVVFFNPAFQNGTDTITTSISHCPAVIHDIPEGFTPNGDSNFDTWAPIGEGIKEIVFTIRSMDDEVLFESYDISSPWDGKYESDPVPTGTYKYHVEGTFYTGITFKYIGTLTLTR